MIQEPEPEYLITDTMLKIWRKGCVNLDEPHTDNEFCKKNCGYRGKGAREKCCDFDDNGMEKIFRSSPHCRHDKDEQLTENQKTTRLLHKAAHDYKIRRDVRERVLEQVKMAAFGSTVQEFKNGAYIYRIDAFKFDLFLEELRKQGDGE